MTTYSFIKLLNSDNPLLWEVAESHVDHLDDTNCQEIIEYIERYPDKFHLGPRQQTVYNRIVKKIRKECAD